MARPLESKNLFAMKIKNLTTLILCLYCLAAFALPATQTNAKEAIKSAHTLLDQSKIAGHEWSTAKPLIAQAKQALQLQKYAKAITLAEKASEQSKLALDQAEHEKNNWLNSLPK